MNMWPQAVTAGKYGALGGIVSTAGAIMAAGAAIALAWRGRSRWEPSEEDIPKGPQKVGGLAAAVIVVVLWLRYAGGTELRTVTWLAIALALVCVVSLLAYIFVITTQTYYVVVSTTKGKTFKRNVVGGFWLRKTAKDAKRRENVTTQELLMGAAYDLDKLWSRPSRALAKMAFVISYLVLTTSGTAALTCAAIGLDARAGS